MDRDAAAMTADPIRIVMLGCGAFARHYHVPAFLADPEARIEAIFDPFPNEEVAALAGSCGARLSRSLDELPSPDGPVLALVTTPHALHAGHVRAALERGWHVLCDKPFVLHTHEARALAAEAERRGALNAVAFNRRLDPGGLRAREIIRSGGIGPVRYVETVQLGYPMDGWIRDPALAGGGPFTGRGTHMADLVPWLLDRVPSRVRARLRDGDGGRVDRGGFLEMLFGHLDCRLTCVEEGWSMWDEVRVFGEDGLLELRRPLDLATGWKMRWHAGRGAPQEVVAADPATGAATRNALDALRGRGSVACSFAEALPSVAIIEAAFASARADGRWRDLAI